MTPNRSGHACAGRRITVGTAPMGLAVTPDQAPRARAHRDARCSRSGDDARRLRIDGRLRHDRRLLLGVRRRNESNEHHTGRRAHLRGAGHLHRHCHGRQLGWHLHEPGVHRPDDVRLQQRPQGRRLAARSTSGARSASLANHHDDDHDDVDSDQRGTLPATGSGVSGSLVIPALLVLTVGGAALVASRRRPS